MNFYASGSIKGASINKILQEKGRRTKKNLIRIEGRDPRTADPQDEEGKEILEMPR